MVSESFLAGRPLTQQISFRSSSQCTPARRMWINAAAKSRRKQEVVLIQDIPKVGAKGTMTTVSTGFYRNYLFPRGLAAPTTEGFLKKLQIAQDNMDKAEAARKAQATAMKMALQTIGKFHIKKKVGEKNHIFGSVTTQEVVDAIEQQTGRAVDKRQVSLPDIKETGTFAATVKLHPEVIGDFKIVVQREKNVAQKEKSKS